MIISRVGATTKRLRTLLSVWPFTIPAVNQVVTNGLMLSKPITVLVGENGSGKSTILEAIAEAYGLDVRGGHGGRKYSSSVPKGPLGRALEIELTKTGGGLRRHNTPGFFLRSETAQGVFEFMSDHGVPGYGERHLARVSHGEGYLQVLEGRFNRPGLYLLDEPEAGLSFTSCLRLVQVLQELPSKGGQVILATHSPILAAIPGVTILELSPKGISEVAWKDLELVDNWKRFMERPSFYL